jgi:hypothetical protein
MKRVYTDPRFPQHEVVNDGDTVFHVILNGEPEDQFVASEDIARDEVSDEFAQRQAKEYFDFLASKQGGEDDWRQDFTGGGTALAEPKPRRKPPGPPGKAPSLPPGKPPGEPSVGLNDMFPEGELVTQDVVDRLIAAARAEQDPERRAQLRQQALSAMQQMESLARCLARVMLS